MDLSLKSGNPVELCEDPCGVSLEVDPLRPPWRRFGDGNGHWSCDALTKTVTEFMRSAWAEWVGVARWKYLRGACESLRGWSVYIEHGQSIEHPWTGESATGIADCYEKAIRITNESPGSGALAHELVHAAANCNGLAQCQRGEDCYHVGWIDAGVVAAIYRTNDALTDAGL